MKERLPALAAQKNLDFMSNDDWDLYIPNIEFSYNITPNRMSGLSPYQIVFGDYIKRPVERILDQKSDPLFWGRSQHFNKTKILKFLEPVQVNKLI